MDNNQKTLEEISRKMNAIISLLILEYEEDKLSTEVEKVAKLSECGLTNDEVAQILGKTSRQVSKLLYKSKKRRNKK